jgi:hypothetical protein
MVLESSGGDGSRLLETSSCLRSVDQAPAPCPFQDDARRCLQPHVNRSHTRDLEALRMHRSAVMCGRGPVPCETPMRSVEMVVGELRYAFGEFETLQQEFECSLSSWHFKVFVAREATVFRGHDGGQVHPAAKLSFFGGTDRAPDIHHLERWPLLWTETSLHALRALFLFHPFSLGSHESARSHQLHGARTESCSFLTHVTVPPSYLAAPPTRRFQAQKLEE